MKTFFISVILITFVFTNLIFAQKKPEQNTNSNKITIQLKYLSTEAISNTYLDSDGSRHPVYINREEALNGFTKKVKEFKGAINQDPEKPDFSKLPRTIYIWKTETEDQDAVKTETLDYDLGKESAVD